MGSLMDAATLEQMLTDARQFNDELDAQRAVELAYYEARPRGDERDGYSKVVSHTVEETIEWALPLIIEAFMVPEPVVFVPTGPDDVRDARLETHTVRQLLFDSRGFEALYTWIKDALLHHNGIVKVWVEENTSSTVEEYRDLDKDATAAVLARPDVEIIEYTETEDEDGVRAYLKVRRAENKPRLRWQAVPPEEFLIFPDWAEIDLSDCQLVAHVRTVTRSNLLEMGFDPEVVERLPADGDELDDTDTGVVRHDCLSSSDGATTPDPSMDRITLYECYVLYDSDGDGIAERRQIFYAGHEILSDRPYSHVPFVAIASQLMPHRFEGRSLASTVLDLQDISTSLWRQVLDNLYLTNNPRLKVAKGGGVNMEDLTTGGPGSPIRMRDTSAVEPIVVPFSAAPSLSIIEYIDKKRGDRTGVGETYTGQSPDVSNRAARQAVERLMTAAEQKIRLIARVVAEVGLCQVYRIAHTLMRERFTNEMLVPYRSDWVSVNPADWRPRERMTVRVGLGHASRLERREVLQELLQTQLALAQSGGMGTIVSLENIYNSLIELLHVSGVEDPERFVTDPTHPAVADILLQNQLRPDPQMLALQLEAQRIQGDQQIKAAELALKEKQTKVAEMEAQSKASVDAARVAVEERKAATAEDAMKAKLEQELARLELERSRLMSEFRNVDTELEAERKQLEARIMQANAQIEMQQLKLAQEELKLRQQMAKAAPEQAQGQQQTQPSASGPVEIIYEGDKPVGIRYPDGTVRRIVEDDEGRPIALTAPQPETNIE